MVGSYLPLLGHTLCCWVASSVVGSYPPSLGRTLLRWVVPSFAGSYPVVGSVAGSNSLSLGQTFRCCVVVVPCRPLLVVVAGMSSSSRHHHHRRRGVVLFSSSSSACCPLLVVIVAVSSSPAPPPRSPHNIYLPPPPRVLPAPSLFFSLPGSSLEPHIPLERGWAGSVGSVLCLLDVVYWAHIPRTRGETPCRVRFVEVVGGGIRSPNRTVKRE